MKCQVIECIEDAKLIVHYKNKDEQMMLCSDHYNETDDTFLARELGVRVPVKYFQVDQDYVEVLA